MAPYIVGRGRDARAGRRKIAFRLQPEKRLVAGLAASSFVPVTSDPWLDTRWTYPLPHARSAGAVVPPPPRSGPSPCRDVEPCEARHMRAQRRLGVSLHSSRPTRRVSPIGRAAGAPELLNSVTLICTWPTLYTGLTFHT